MDDPTTLKKCPNCHGTGTLGKMTDCEECFYFNANVPSKCDRKEKKQDCTEVIECHVCDGTGEVTPHQHRTYMMDGD